MFLTPLFLRNKANKQNKILSLLTLIQNYIFSILLFASLPSFTFLASQTNMWPISTSQIPAEFFYFLKKEIITYSLPFSFLMICILSKFLILSWAIISFNRIFFDPPKWKEALPHLLHGTSHFLICTVIFCICLIFFLPVCKLLILGRVNNNFCAKQFHNLSNLTKWRFICGSYHNSVWLSGDREEGEIGGGDSIFLKSFRILSCLSIKWLCYLPQP